MAPETFKTAESITRFLRSKDAELNEVLGIARQLLDGDIEVYLPNRQLFVLLLLCDRLNDLNRYKKWKLDKRVWEILNELYASSENTKPYFNRVFKRIKIIEILITILEVNSLKKVDAALLTEVFTFMHNILRDSVLFVGESHFLSIIGLYCKCICLLPFENEEYIKICNNWSKVISEIERSSNFKLFQKNNKKYLNKYLLNVLPFALQIVGLEAISLKPTINIIENNLVEKVFQKDLINLIRKDSFSFLKNPEIEASMLKSFFKLSVKYLTTKDMGIYEDFLKQIVAYQRFSFLAEELLGMLSTQNRMLSKEFSKSLFEKEMSITNTNWALVKYLIDLDIELAVENAMAILTKSSNYLSASSFLDLFNHLVNAYVSARELSTLITDILLKAIHERAEWVNEDLINILARNTKDLTIKQLTSLLLQLFGDPQLHILVTGLLKGIAYMPPDAVEQMKNVIIGYKDTIFSHEKNWEMKFYCLCLYGFELILQDRKGLLRSLEQVDESSIYFYFFSFRLKEICEDAEINHIVDSFMHYVDISKGNFEVVIMCLKRWPLLINACFSKEKTKILIGHFLQSSRESEVLQYFSENSDVFFEQRELSEAFLVKLWELIIVGKLRSRFSSSLIVFIPAECISKGHRPLLIDALCEEYSKVSGQSDKVDIKVALCHILQRPSYRSRLEVDSFNCIKLFDLNSCDQDVLNSKIASLIWNSKLRMVGNESNRQYILDLLNLLCERLSHKRVNHGISVESKIALVILKNDNSVLTDSAVEDSLKYLQECFVSLLHDLMKYQMSLSLESSEEALIWLFEALDATPCELIKDSKFWDLLNRIAARLQQCGANSKANMVRKSLFKLKAETIPPTFNSALFLLALFTNLRVNFGVQNESLRDSVKLFLGRLDEDTGTLIEILNYVSFSAQEKLEKKYLEVIIDITGILFRESQKSLQKEYRYMFSRTIDSFIMNFQSFLEIEERTFVQFLNTVKYCLKEKSWIFSQYSIENLLCFVAMISLKLKELIYYNTVDIYILLTQIVSHILLFHRYRLSLRTHLILATCSTLLVQLSSSDRSSKEIFKSKDAAVSYSRLLSNLCEPNASFDKSSTNSLSYSTANIRRSLRKYITVLLSNFIFLALNHPFNELTYNDLIEAFYSIFDLLSPREMNLVGKSLETSSKAYFKSLYASYKMHGKWVDK